MHKKINSFIQTTVIQMQSGFLKITRNRSLFNENENALLND